MDDTEKADKEGDFDNLLSRKDSLGDMLLKELLDPFSGGERGGFHILAVDEAALLELPPLSRSRLLVETVSGTEGSLKALLSDPINIISYQQVLVLLFHSIINDITY